MKRDISLFDILKSKKHFKEWHSDLISISAIQDVEEVLDPTYTPTSPEDIDIFQEKIHVCRCGEDFEN